MKPHVLFVMPFDTKPGHDASPSTEGRLARPGHARYDHMSRAIYANLFLLVNPPKAVRKGYAATAPAANRDCFALKASLQALCLLHKLKFRPNETPAALDIIDRSIFPSTDGEKWRDHYYVNRAAPKDPPRVMPSELCPLPRVGRDRTTSPIEHGNLWLLCTALKCGVDKGHFICLWNGEGRDGSGGTAHTYQEVKRRTGRVTWLDTRTLW